ncbi:EF-hand [Durotheca rogersii]|uniref:EF-hand n=1 Tax=Durotheca rogersii TaxID=419775 RepID=UPI002221165E|nr:EF-hand [Durotheca rogersii]KAI5864502.1 EF-hand [Durotheca rogersii]
MAMPAGYKPSPLGYGSPRSSPFRRPESPGSSPSAPRQNSISVPATAPTITPTTSPTKVSGVHTTPSRFATVSSPTGSTDSQTTPRTLSQTHGSGSRVDMSPRAGPSLAPPPHISSSRSPPPPPHARPHSFSAQGSALSQLQPAQVRVLRDGFQILDRDSDGVVNRDDVADMLNQLGLPSSPADLSQFFPAGGPATTTLPAFLNSIAAALAALSPSAELLSAFSAFDDDDSGQVDLAELRDALLHTTPEPGERALSLHDVDKIMAGFSGRRAFTKHRAGASSSGGGLGSIGSVSSNVGGGIGTARRGEVFKYQDFVNSIVGRNGVSEPNSNEHSEG